MRDILSGTIVAVIVATASTVGAQVQTAAQQKCLKAMASALTKVVQAQQARIAGCLKLAATGKLPAGQTAEQCLSADVRGRVAKAIAKTVEAEGKLCGRAPSFGFGGAAALNAAAVNDGRDLEQVLFGPDLSPVAISRATDRLGAGCQAKVTKAVQQLLLTELGVYHGCKQKGLKGGQITSSPTLDACLDAITDDVKEKIGKAVEKLGKIVADKCQGVTLGSAFPGACAGAPDLGACLAVRSRCETCQTVLAADALSRSCDVFDDGIVNGSCNACVDDNSGGVGIPCDEPVPPPPGATSPCRAGTTACVAGTIVCTGAVGPTGADTCNVDANCDGTLTNQPNLQTDANNCGICGNECLAGKACVAGGCVADFFCIAYGSIGGPDPANNNTNVGGCPCRQNGHCAGRCFCDGVSTSQQVAGLCPSDTLAFAVCETVGAPVPICIDPTTTGGNGNRSAAGCPCVQNGNCIGVCECAGGAQQIAGVCPGPAASNTCS